MVFGMTQAIRAVNIIWWLVCPVVTLLQTNGTFSAFLQSNMLFPFQDIKPAGTVLWWGHVKIRSSYTLHLLIDVQRFVTLKRSATRIKYFKTNIRWKNMNYMKIRSKNATKWLVSWSRRTVSVVTGGGWWQQLEGFLW